MDYRPIEIVSVMWLPDPDVVQHISLPLELLGLFLVLIELFYREAANKLESLIDGHSNLSIPFLMKIREGNWPLQKKQVVLLWFMSTAYPIMVIMLLWYSLGTVILVPVAAFVFLGFWLEEIGAGVQRFPEWGFKRLKRWVVYAVVWIILPFFICLYLGYLAAGVILLPLKGLLMAFNRLGDGHGIGGIGLMLGFVGFTGEVYQVLMIDRDAEPMAIIEYWSLIALLIVTVSVITFFIHRSIKRSSRP